MVLKTRAILYVFILVIVYVVIFIKSVSLLFQSENTILSFFHVFYKISLLAYLNMPRIILHDL
jgi:hypothetical protein